MMPNPSQPTIGPGAKGDVVRRLQRALHRTPDLGISVDGVFRPQLEAAVKSFQEGSGLAVDGVVGPLTWNALPATPLGIDGFFGPHTKASVEAFQAWGGVTVDGVVEDQTWSVSLHAASSTLESAVGLNGETEPRRTIW
jgi:peptidoglycan hydrolase-like protein with peptidoglycan-binding domain